MAGRRPINRRSSLSGPRPTKETAWGDKPAAKDPNRDRFGAKKRAPKRLGCCKSSQEDWYKEDDDDENWKRPGESQAEYEKRKTQFEVEDNWRKVFGDISAPKKQRRSSSAGRQRRARSQSGSVGHAPDGSRKLALVVSLTYHDDTNWSPLRGTDLDGLRMIEFLEADHWTGHQWDITWLSDTDLRANGIPTRKRMIIELKRLAEIAKEGDTIFFHYAGHGTQVPDRNNDEGQDAMDEALVLVGTETAGYKSTERILTDDELSKQFVEALHDGVKCFCVIDACHSGSMLDLEFERKSGGSALNPNNWDWVDTTPETVPPGRKGESTG